MTLTFLFLVLIFSCPLDHLSNLCHGHWPITNPSRTHLHSILHLPVLPTLRHQVDWSVHPHRDHSGFTSLPCPKVWSLLKLHLCTVLVPWALCLHPHCHWLHSGSYVVPFELLKNQKPLPIVYQNACCRIYFCLGWGPMSLEERQAPGALCGQVPCQLLLTLTTSSALSPFELQVCRTPAIVSQASWLLWNLHPIFTTHLAPDYVRCLFWIPLAPRGRGGSVSIILTKLNCKCLLLFTFFLYLQRPFSALRKVIVSQYISNLAQWLLNEWRKLSRGLVVGHD